MKKGLKITIGIISSLLVLILLFLSVYFWWPWNKEFFNNADEEFLIPGLDTHFVPQGMTRITNGDKYLISGYMSDGSPSRFYLLDENKKVEKYVTLAIGGDKDHVVPYTGHAGGVASHGNSLWTVSYVEEEGKGYAFRFKLSSLDSASSGDALFVDSDLDCFPTYNNADFAFTYDNMLWVGEFYKPDKYETDSAHRLTTRTGETNPAIVYGFSINESSKFSIKSWISGMPFPEKALSIRGLCQGISVTDGGKFVMTTSYSIPDSNIYYYQNVLSEFEHKSDYKIGNTSVPLWFLDNESLISTTNAPSMVEESFVMNDRVYLLFESACKKYKTFNRKRLTNVYSLPLTYLEK